MTPQRLPIFFSPRLSPFFSRIVLWLFNFTAHNISTSNAPGAGSCPVLCLQLLPCQGLQALQPLVTPSGSLLLLAVSSPVVGL